MSPLKFHNLNFHNVKMVARCVNAIGERALSPFVELETKRNWRV
jgi:hypothetical protein